MNRRFVQDNRVLSKVYAKRRVAGKKSLRDFSGLAHQVFLVFGKLLVFSWVVADDDDFYVVVLRYRVKRGVVNHGRFNRVGRSVGGGRFFLQGNQCWRKRAPFGAFFFVFVAEGF